MALHPRLQARQRGRLANYLAEWLMLAGGLLLLIGFAILPWRAPGYIQLPPTELSQLVTFYLIPIAGLIAVAAAGWGMALRAQTWTAAALALVAGSIALLYFAQYAFAAETSNAIGFGFVVALLGMLLLFAQIFLPRPLPPGLNPSPLDQTLLSHLRWLRVYVLLLAIIAFLGWVLPQIVAKPTYRILHSGIQGVLEGSLYALIALGIIIINKATGVFNFGHGAMMLFGGLILFSFFQNQAISPFFALLYAAIFVAALLFTTEDWRRPRRLALSVAVGLILAFLLVFGGAEWWVLHAAVGTMMGAILLGLIVERVAIRPLIGQPFFAVVLATLALDILLRGIARVFWGPQPVNIPLFYFISRPAIQIEAGGGRVFIITAALVGMVLALLAYTAFILFFRFSRVGLAMRAAAENQTLAQSLGLQVRILLSFTWGIAAVFAALAGTLLGASKGLDPAITPALALKAFPAVLLGGLESIPGALIGGLVLGIAEQYSILLYSNDVATQLVPFGLLMIVLIIRPEGLFGLKRIERI